MSENAVNQFNSGYMREVFRDILLVHCQKKALRIPYSVSLSRRAGMSESAVKKWLGGDGLPSLENFYQLCEFFGEDFKTHFEEEIGLPPGKPIKINNDREGLLIELAGLMGDIIHLNYPLSPHKSSIDRHRIDVLRRIGDVQQLLVGYSAHLRQCIEFHREAA